MKNLKSLLIAVSLVFAFASCEKSDIKPKGCGNSSATEQEPAPNQNVTGRVKTTTPTSGAVISYDEPLPNDIVGGGDDDREGGDKKPKTAGK